MNVATVVRGEAATIVILEVEILPMTIVVMIVMVVIPVIVVMLIMVVVMVVILMTITLCRTDRDCGCKERSHCEARIKSQV